MEHQVLSKEGQELSFLEAISLNTDVRCLFLLLSWLKHDRTGLQFTPLALRNQSVFTYNTDAH